MCHIWRTARSHRHAVTYPLRSEICSAAEPTPRLNLRQVGLVSCVHVLIRIRAEQKQALNVTSLNFILTGGAILHAAQRAGMDVDAVFQKVAAANMRKLRERYKAGFNLKDAESRDRDAERAALERTERLAAAPQRGGKERD